MLEPEGMEGIVKIRPSKSTLAKLTEATCTGSFADISEKIF